MAEHGPIIIIGAARSGTKFLRDCLAAGAGVAAVPYDVNYVWRYGSKSAHDALDPADLKPKTASFIRQTLPRLAKAAQGDRLIEKTVSNTLRVPYVNAVFPDAVFVHLLRDGRDVTESAMRQWVQPPDTGALWTKLRAMPLRNLGYVAWYAANLAKGALASGRKGGGVWGPRYPGIDKDVATKSLVEVCAQQWQHSVETAKRDLESLPQDRVIEVSYEALTTKEGAFADLAATLQLPDQAASVDRFNRKLAGPQSLQGWQTLAEEDRKSGMGILEPTLKKLGYLQ